MTPPSMVFCALTAAPCRSSCSATSTCPLEEALREVLGGVGRCGEMWGGVGRCGGVCDEIFDVYRRRG